MSLSLMFSHIHYVFMIIMIEFSWISFKYFDAPFIHKINPKSILFFDVPTRSEMV